MSVRRVVADAYRSALPTLAVSAVGGLAAGVVLGGMDAQLSAVEGLLVLVPAFLAIRGSVYGSLGSRLSSALHQGLIDPAEGLVDPTDPDPRLVTAAAAALLNGVLASVFAAVLTVVVLTALRRPVAPLGTFLIIALVGGVLAGIALTAVVVGVVLLGYRRGLNPDTSSARPSRPRGTSSACSRCSSPSGSRSRCSVVVIPDGYLLMLVAQLGGRVFSG